MSASEFGLWLAFLEKEPIGWPAATSMWGTLMAAIVNGPLQRADRRKWTGLDFAKSPWVPPPEKKPPSLAELRAHAAGKRLPASRRRH